MTQILGLASAVLSALAAVAPADGPAADAPAVGGIIPGFVADPAGRRGYAANDAGGVDALDLETGKVLWTSKARGRPVAADAGRVLVLRPSPREGTVLCVAALDAEDGREVLKSDRLPFPTWVYAAAASPRRGAAFAARGCIDGGNLLLAWQARAGTRAGGPPRKEEGVLRIDLTSGKAEALTAGQIPPPSPPAAAVPDAVAREAARDDWADTPGQRKVVTAGGFAVVLDVALAGAAVKKVVLRRWDLSAAKEVDPVTLAEGDALQVVGLPAEGVALVRRVGLPETASEEDAAWNVFSLETGKKTATFLSEPDMGPVTVVGPRAYYVLNGPPSDGPRPRTLKAVDLKSGKRLWERPLDGDPPALAPGRGWTGGPGGPPPGGPGRPPPGGPRDVPGGPPPPGNG